jgi:hypothetical protein
MEQQGNIRTAKLRLLPELQTVRKNDDGSVTVHIPITFVKEGGKRYIITPPHPLDDAPPGTVDTKGMASKPRMPILKALAQAFEWMDMIDRGEASSSRELAKKLKVNESYLARILRLTLLAPDIIEALLDGKQPEKLTLADLLKPVPYDWNEQRVKYGFAVAVD